MTEKDSAFDDIQKLMAEVHRREDALYKALAKIQGYLDAPNRSLLKDSDISRIIEEAFEEAYHFDKNRARRA